MVCRLLIQRVLRDGSQEATRIPSEGGPEEEVGQAPLQAPFFQAPLVQAPRLPQEEEALEEGRRRGVSLEMYVVVCPGCGVEGEGSWR